MAMAPAEIPAIPAVTTTRVATAAPESPAARANGTVSPSAMPMTTSRTVSLEVKWCSMWGVSGIRTPDLSSLDLTVYSGPRPKVHRCDPEVRRSRQKGSRQIHDHLADILSAEKA